MPYHFLIHDFDSFNPNSDWEFGDSSFDLNLGNHLTRHDDSLKKEGWKIMKMLKIDEFQELEGLLTQYVKKQLTKYQNVEDSFSLENYHEFVDSDTIHYSVSSWALPQNIITPIFDKIKQKMEDFLQAPLAIKKIEHKGITGSFIGFRIVRPGRTDYSPLHRDAWLSYWKDTINVWIPITGFENGNTINLLPKTHLLNDSEILRTKKGAIINGKSYHVPAAIALKKPFDQVKPSLEAGEALIFSPYILHGNGSNNLPNKTRVSIELRFCLKS